MTIWLSKQIVLAIHDEQLAEHGGAIGVRNDGLLESALARPLNLASYGEPDIAELAAMYALGVVRNHPFIDGNKRTGYVMLETILLLNGATFPVSDGEAVITILRLAAGDLTDDAFADWVRSHTRLPP
ncbi:MAG TPA: type II toxin-antitoxin system death-on-curing family toxin [Acetobacteraceae bacterium]|nr:type II toxin-antitoxin system death-on-curing family toxin [Acetobacteraceae bacterium]